MEFLTYLAKASLFTILFYGFYALLIRRTTFFHLNRAYLIMALMASFLLPFAEIEEKVILPATLDEVAYPLVDEIAVSPVSTVEKATADITAVQVFLALYLCGAVLFLVLLLVRLAKAFSLFRSCSPVLTEDIPVVLLEGNQSGSFSFFNRIFISRTDFEHHFDTVYRHERIHVSQKHSLDILLTELCQVFLWFNPAMRLYKHAFQEVHEFLADTSAADRESYARFLVSYAMSATDKLPLAHPFLSRLTLKQRIRMLYRERDSGYTLGRYLLIIPVAAAVVALTASRQYVYISEGSAPAKSLPIEIPAVTLTAAKGTTSPPAPQALDIPVGTPAMTLKSGKETASQAVFTVEDRKISGKVVDAATNSPLPGATILAKGLTFGTTTDSEGNYTLTIPADSREIVVSFVGFISKTVLVDGKSRIDVALSTNRNQLEEIVVVGYGPVKRAQQQAKPAPAHAPGEFLVVEAMPEFPGGYAELRKYLARNIRYPAEAMAARIQGKVYIAFTVNKSGYIRNPRVLQGPGYGTDEEAIRLVTSMPPWKPGKQNEMPVDVEYTLPISFVLDPPEENMQGYFSSPDKLLIEPVDQPRTRFPNGEGAPLYLVEGKEKHGLNEINPNSISSIIVLKGDSAVRAYGPRAANGVVLITLKK